MSYEELDQQTKFKIEAMVKQWGEEMRSESVLICSKSGGRYKDKARKYNQCGHLGEDEEVDITYFQGKYDPELYLQWERNMEIAFCHHNYSEFKKVNLASKLLSDYALTWWDRLAKSRRRNGVEPIMTWKEMKVVMRKHFAPSHYYRENQNSWRQSQATTLSYSKRSFWEKDEMQKKRYIDPFVKPRSDSSSFSIPTCDDGGVVIKDEREDPKVTVMEEHNEEVEEIEAPSGPLTLFGEIDLDMQNEVDDGEQQENIFHVEDKVLLVPLTPTQAYEEDQEEFSKKVEMVMSNEEKVETNENVLMHEPLLDPSDDLELVVHEKKFVEAKLSKENANDLYYLSPSIHSLQDFEDVVHDTFFGLLSIQGSQHQIELEGINELESMLSGEKKRKHNFFTFAVGGDQDLRTNLLQEEGNDEARRSWISIHGPRIKDDMG